MSLKIKCRFLIFDFKCALVCVCAVVCDGQVNIVGRASAQVHAGPDIDSPAV